MKSHAKRAIKHLEALGFTLDETSSNPRKGKYVYRHPNDPGQPLKVFAGESDTTSTTLIRKANAIAEAGWTGPKLPSTIGERARIKKSRERAEREQADRARAERARKAEAEHDARERAARDDRHVHDIQSLMQPGYGR